MPSLGSPRKPTAPPIWAAKALGPLGMALEHRDHRGMRDEAPRPGLARRPAKQSAGFGGGAVARIDFDQRGAGSGADDLDEAEAIDRGPLERLRQDGVDRRSRCLARCLAVDRRQVDPDRSGEAKTADCQASGARPGNREFVGGERPVDIDQDHRRSRRNAQPPAGKLNDPARRFLEQVGPARRIETDRCLGKGRERRCLRARVPAMALPRSREPADASTLHCRGSLRA